jgi:hypothetical protein
MIEKRRSILHGEFIGEAVLLAIVGCFFVYLFVGSLKWPLGAALMPRIAVALGTPFLIARIFMLIRGAEKEPSRREIMDTGFSQVNDPKAARKRFVRICGFICGLYLSIWIFGFHFALPIGVFLYLTIYGKMNWILSGLVALFLIALMIGMYDNIIHTDWGDPLILQIWNGLNP